MVDFKKDAVEREIHHLSEQISEVNISIINLEDKTNPEYKKSLDSKLRIKSDELHSHNQSKPIEIIDPDLRKENSVDNQKRQELESWQLIKNDLDVQISTVRNEVSSKSITISELQSLKRDLTNKIDDLKTYIDLNLINAATLGVDLNQIVSFKFDSGLIDQKIVEIGLEIDEHRKNLEVDLIGDTPYDQLTSLQAKHDWALAKIFEIQSMFSGEQKDYQDYLIALQSWEASLKAIEGNVDTPDSLIFIRAELEYVSKKLLDDLSKLRLNRLNFSRDIFKKKQEIKSFYDDIKSAIDQQLLTSEVIALKIVSSFYTSSTFEEYLLRNIKQNRTGSFYGSDDGKNLLHNELVVPTNWDDLASFEIFLNKFIEHLEVDARNELQSVKTFIGDIVKDRKELYNYLFSLDYLEQHYDLQQNGKSLEQLSPGEKGALLLVFYLVLDKEDIPLIIDQPEDNLDNHSVAKILVPYIKQAKKKRQIILVTHNPNLAVVSDSEQVIRVNIDKLNGNKFNFISGGIEEASINTAIVEVLEGTLPAFTTRRDKYQFNASV